MPPSPRPPIDRFMEKVSVDPEGCWLWTGAASSYKRWRPYFRADTHRTVIAYRWIYEHLHGPIPAGFELDHLCCVPLCVNPAHLEAVTPAENAGRTRLTVCPNGHDLTDPAHMKWDKQGRRRGCITCGRDAAREKSRERQRRLVESRRQ